MSVEKPILRPENQEYRDDLAKKLKEARTEDGSRDRTEKILKEEKQTEEYQKAKKEKIDKLRRIKREKVKQLFGHCFEISNLEEGDLIPVGGESIFSSVVSKKVEGDFENFKDFFAETNSFANKHDLVKTKAFLNNHGIEIDEKIFIKLYAFTKRLEETYPENIDRDKTRKKLYEDENDKQLKLSDIFNENAAACAEISALAQKFLQRENISSSYFSGDVLWDKNHEFSSPHSFIVIRQEEKFFIYDPTNPINTNMGKFPSIYTTDVDFDEEMAKGQKRFVTLKNTLSKKEHFFGVNDHTNIWPEKHIV